MRITKVVGQILMRFSDAASPSADALRGVRAVPSRRFIAAGPVVGIFSKTNIHEWLEDVSGQRYKFVSVWTSALPDPGEGQVLIRNQDGEDRCAVGLIYASAPRTA